MEAKANPTLTRRRQRRPDLESTFDIPEDVQQLIAAVRHALLPPTHRDGAQVSAAASKVMAVSDRALAELLEHSLTPAQQLHAVSKITGAVKDVPKATLAALLTAPCGELYRWGRTLALEVVVPMLLDCRVRYLHRALMTLLRTLVPTPDAATEAVVRDLYVSRVLRGPGAGVAAAAGPRSLPSESLGTATTNADAAAAVYLPPAANHDGDASEEDMQQRDASLQASRDTVLNTLNAVDGLTSTLMPMMPSVFRDTFLEALPLLTQCFQWVVANATRHSRAHISRGAAAAATVDETAEEDGEKAEPADGSASADGTADSDSTLQPEAVGGAVFGEDLEHIRFCVRVVATYVHKYMDSLTAAMVSGAVASTTSEGSSGEEHTVNVSQQLARLLQPTVVMMTSSIFPKDVLNAVGLLVASILTVRTCDGWLLAAVCAALREDVTHAANAVATATRSGSSAEVEARASSSAGPAAVVAASPHSLADLFRSAEVALAVVCAADPRKAALADAGRGARAVHHLFSAFTPNGCFALLKGILAHVSSPIRRDWLSFGLLLTPASPDGVVVAYDSVLPAAQAFCNVVQEPETRFMAIQTVDSVVRHVNAVLRTALMTLRKCGNEAEKQPRSAPALTGQAEGGAAVDCLTVQESSRLRVLCTSTEKLQQTLAFSTQLIMALWDDSTQQVSGALYGTYNEILSITETLSAYRQYCAASSSEAQTADTAAALTSAASVSVVTLESILEVQAERRGKYHALLGHLSMMPLASFVAALQRHYHCEASAAAAVAAFARTLLSGASNHKIGNVAGDVFAQLARQLKAVPSEVFPSTDAAAAQSTTETAADVLRCGIIDPLARAIIERGYVAVSANVSDAVNISHITAHFVAPLVKQDAAILHAILAAVVQHGGAGASASSRPTASSSSSPSSLSSHLCARVEQGVVEVLARARGVGVDIIPFIAPGSTAWGVLEASTYSLNYEVRNSALCLCVLGTKKIQAVQPWQLSKVAEYLVLNMHLGGDSTARKGLLEMLKKWLRRLTESYASKGAAGGSDDAKSPSKKARQEMTVAQPAGHASTASAAATSVPVAGGDVLELGTPAYRRAVVAHCSHLADIFSQNIGVDLRASAGLAVERRVTAMLGYILLLQSTRHLTTEDEANMWTGASVAAEAPARRVGGDGASSHALLRLSIVPALLATMSDGWSQARESARDLLHLLCDASPAAVLLAAAGDGGAAPSAEMCAALMERAHQDLLTAQTYRNAEGAVQRFLLFATRSPAAAAAADVGRPHPQRDLARLQGLFDRERASVVATCAAMGGMRGSASYAYIQAHPLHGSLSLCAELLTSMAAAERQLTLCPADSPAAATSRPEVVTEACTALLQCCCVVLRTCSSLVGTETVTAGATAGQGEHEVVDCRGHVYDRSRPEAESVMRGVVNNTWLSMRVATTAVDRVLKVRAVHQLPFDAVRAAAYGLVHALLLTKHNGVMRCVREALKALAATLVRSREPQFYQLPGELLDYLLGPEGVTSGDMARMLRRSQGLPHALLAVLEAEDTAVPYSLFPRAMRQLTRVARGEVALSGDVELRYSSLGSTADDIRRSQRSNALNVLKFIFEDRVFADRVVAHIEDAFSLATEGFHDASWYTRNSSLMLFSAVIHRFVGEHPSTGGSGVNTSLHDVAKRTPRGVAYAYAELTRGGGGGIGHDAEVNVALFPVLQLLSMLSPDPPHLITKASHSEWDDTARMSAAVIQCAASPSLMVRSASAVALCCLVPIASLAAVIAQTKDALSLRGGAPSRVGESARAASAASVAGPQPSGGLNACHGALLQLLQFHAQYVGTVRRHYRQKRSSYATPAVAAVVRAAVVDAVLSSGATLVKVCAVCPTAAATLFALLADLVHFAPQKQQQQHHDHSLSQDEVQHQQQRGDEALRQMCVSALVSYMTASHGVLERGSVLEAASAMLVFMAAQHASPIGAWTPAEQASLAGVLRSEADAMDISRGEHNLVSWLAMQLVHYSDAATMLLDHEKMISVLQVLAAAAHCDVLSEVFASLDAFFDSGDGCGAAGPAAMARMGCIAWSQLVAHLRFAAAAMALLPLTESAGVAVSPLQQLASSPAAQRLYTALCTLLAPSGSDSEEGFVWQNSDGCSAAVDYVTCYDMYATTAAATASAPPSMSAPVAGVLAFCAEPEQPLESRLAVVKALRTALPFLRHSVAACAMEGSEGGSRCPAAAVTLLLVLVRLLVDDTSDIREAAAIICSHALWGAQEAPRDQVSCLLAVTRHLRQLRVRDADSVSATAVRAVLSVSDMTAETKAMSEGEDGDADEEEREEADGGEKGDDENDDEEDNADVLFQKEAANMFAEETVLLCLYGYIFGDDSATDADDDVAAACRSYSLFDSLLRK